MTTTQTTVETQDGTMYLTTGERVTVGGKPGTLVYATRDGWLGVRLDGEGARVDEWQPAQVVRS